jgi:hypothetical protein
VLTTPLHKKRMLRITHVQMLPLETKQSGGELLPHSDLRGGVFLEEVSRNRAQDRGAMGTGWSWLRIGTGGGHLWVR